MNTKTLLVLLLTTLSPITVHAQIDQEANQQAQKFWHSRITKCGDDYYGREKILVRQFRNPTVVVRASRLTQADKLNGIEYLGITFYRPEVTRNFAPKGTMYQAPGWSNWQTVGNNQFAADMIKKNGRWEVKANLTNPAAYLQPVDCSSPLNLNENQDKEYLLNKLPPLLNLNDSTVLAALKEYGLVMVCNPIPIYMQENPKSKSNTGIDVRSERILPVVDEINDGCENGKPNPLTLVVEIASNGNLTLNNEKQGSISGQNTLLGTLTRIFRERRENSVYREGTNDIENTVTIKVRSKIDKDVFVKTLKLISRSGSSPVALYVAK